eukprot:jgi/Psemu1/327564/estExt_fgenesh1_pg.C_7140005
MIARARRLVGLYHPKRPPFLFRHHPRRSSFSSRSPASFGSLFDQVTVTCLPGLELVLSAELQMLGIKHTVPSSVAKKKDGKIYLQKYSSIDDLFRCCLYLGSASQLRLRCASFSARGLPELKRKTARIPWNEIFGKVSTNDNIDVRVQSSKSKLYHTGAIRERIVQGINQHYGLPNENDGKKEEEKEGKNSKRKTKHGSDSSPKILLDVHINYDQVEIFINAFPEPLHRRGYRTEFAKAPLREDLAFAMLFAAGWTPSWTIDDKDITNEQWQGLVDPFCGSGTIAIEGAAMILGLPPGRFRDHSPFQGTKLEDSKKWSTAIRKSFAASEGIRQQVGNESFSISASDRDAGAVKASKINAERAGVLNALTIQTAPLSGQTWFETPLSAPESILVVTNPPFGRRVSSKSTSSTKGLLPLYQSLGKYVECLVQEHDRRVTLKMSEGRAQNGSWREEDHFSTMGRKSKSKGAMLTEELGLIFQLTLASIGMSVLLISWEDISMPHPMRIESSALLSSSSSSPKRQFSMRWGRSTVRGMASGVRERQAITTAEDLESSTYKNLPSYNEVMLAHRTERIPLWNFEEGDARLVTSGKDVVDSVRVVQLALLQILDCQELAQNYEWDQLIANLNESILRKDLENACYVLKRADNFLTREARDEIGFDWGSCSWRHCGALSDAQEAIDALEYQVGMLEPFECIYCLDVVERSLRDILAVTNDYRDSAVKIPEYIPIQRMSDLSNQDDEDILDRQDKDYMDTLSFLRNSDF